MRHLFLSGIFLLAAAGLVFAQREFGFDNRKPSGQPYLKPEETMARMKVADGFEVGLFAAEPLIVNPIAFTVDERGRIWAIESFEYPKRTPKGKMPRDRIVILEDTDGDGKADKRTVFAEGKDFPKQFDLASGIEVGNGGVYVGAPPYLWFIENKNDKPGKFEVLLEGFGSQDTHETLNTFQWGPDGQLYGLHGVFTVSEVRGGKDDAPVKMNAAVWRFHPKTKKFEIYAEGTSNPWGMDWRNSDGQWILCCCVIPHLYHIVPGGIYRRQAGASFNPYAYGELKEICDHTFHRESGWAHAGLVALDAPHIPEKYRDSVIFGSIHGCSIKQNILKQNGSTFTASRGDDFLVSGDKNVRPINMKWGPGGVIYLSDWHDQNPCHQALPDAWDYERGRIYTLKVKGHEPRKSDDLTSKPVEELVERVVNGQDPWEWRTALRLVHELPELGITDELFQKLLRPNRSMEVTRMIWLLGPRLTEEQISGLSQRLGRFTARRLLPEEGRAVTFRLFGDLDKPSAESAEFIGKLVSAETSPVVRREAASAAVRMSGKIDTWPIIRRLLLERSDVNDPVIPQLTWQALEQRLLGEVEQILPWLADNAPGNAFITDYIIPRVMRRLVASGKTADLAASVEFVASVGDPAVKKRALGGLAESARNRQFDAPRAWAGLQTALLNDADPDVRRFIRQLAVSFRDPVAMKRALETANNSTKPLEDRLEAVRALATLKSVPGLALLKGLLKDDSVGELRIEAIRSLAAYDAESVPIEIIAVWTSLPAPVRAEAANLLAGRKEWAKQLLDAVAAKKIARTDLTDNTILRMRSFNDGKLNDQVEKVWGKYRRTPETLLALIDSMRKKLEADGPTSFSRGKVVFENQCAKCHQFEGKGASVGPALDGAARDVEYLLGNILDPNRVIGAPYFIHVVERKNGTNEVGLLAAEDDQSITLKIENGVQKVILKKDVETRQIQEKSMMPEGLAEGMTAQDFRDLVRYVMANPFISHVTIDGNPKLTGPYGRLPVPIGKSVIRAEVTAPSQLRSRLLLGGNSMMEVHVNGKPVYKGQPGDAAPDQAAVDLALRRGVNIVEFTLPNATKESALFARFHDPDRKLRYPDGPAPK